MRFFVVGGEGSFPFRMLARTPAWPATDADADLITLACPTIAPRQEIRLATNGVINAEEWKRHKWPLVRVEG